MEKLENFKIKGHKGTWYSLDTGKKFMINGKETTIYLFEHETYGDEAPCVIADDHGNVILQDIHNGWDDWYEYLSNIGYNKAHQNIIINY